LLSHNALWLNNGSTTDEDVLPDPELVEVAAYYNGSIVEIRKIKAF